MMHKPERGVQINFEPPSDFVGETASGGRKWLKWFGIGCAGMTLIIALVMVFGGFKVVSCCSGLIETGKLTIAAEGFSQEFAGAVKSGEFETAYAMTSVEHFQSQKTLTQFTAQFMQHEDLLARSMPVVSNFTNIDASPEQEPRWEVSMRMLPPDGDEMLTMNLKIGGMPAASKEDVPRFEVLDVQVDMRKRDIAAEAPAVAASEFQNLIRLGDYEGAYKQFGREVAVDGTDDANTMSEDAFKMFIKENESVFTRPVMDVVRVAYENSNEAQVSLRVGTPDQIPVLISFKMMRASMYGGWKVWEISPEPVLDNAPTAVELDDSVQDGENDE